MVNLPRFSDILTQFGTGFSNFSQPKSNSVLSVPQAKAPESASPADLLSISSVKSNSPGASFDRVDQSSPIAVKNDGTYRPKPMMTQFSSSLNFSFSASLRNATVVQRPIEQAQSVTRLSESMQYSYRAEGYSARNVSGGSYSEVKRFQTDMFFSRTRTLSQQLSPPTGQKLESTGQQVARRFEIEISLDASFLRQFNVQTEGLADDEDLLGQYLDDAGGLAKESGEALQAFFDEVDQILNDTEAFMKSSLGSFLSDVKAAFGLNDAEADAFNDMLQQEVTAFFEDVDAFLSDMRQPVLQAATASASEIAPPPVETEAIPEGVASNETAVLV